MSATTPDNILDDIRKRLKEANDKLKLDASAGNISPEEAGDIVSLTDEEENIKTHQDDDFDEVVLEEKTKEKMEEMEQENINKVKDDIISSVPEENFDNRASNQNSETSSQSHETKEFQAHEGLEEQPLNPKNIEAGVQDANHASEDEEEWEFLEDEEDEDEIVLPSLNLKPNNLSKVETNSAVTLNNSAQDQKKEEFEEFEFDDNIASKPIESQNIEKPLDSSDKKPKEDFKIEDIKFPLPPFLKSDTIKVAPKFETKPSSSEPENINDAKPAMNVVKEEKSADISEDNEILSSKNQTKQDASDDLKETTKEPLTNLEPKNTPKLQNEISLKEEDIDEETEEEDALLEEEASEIEKELSDEEDFDNIEEDNIEEDYDSVKEEEEVLAQEKTETDKEFLKTEEELKDGDFEEELHEFETEKRNVGGSYSYEEPSLLQKIPNYSAHDISLEEPALAALTDKITNILEKKLQSLVDLQTKKEENSEQQITVEDLVSKSLPPILEKWIDKNQDLILNRFEQMAEKYIAEAILKLKK